MPRFTPPAALMPSHEIDGFDCGNDALNQWLLGRALRNQRLGASRTFVSVDRDAGRVAGFYSLSTATLEHAESPGKLRRNMPSPIPAVLIGRLATDRMYAGLGLGASLLRDALARCLAVAQSVGVRAVIVHAKTDELIAFYERFGFHRMPTADRTLFILTQDIEATLDARRS